MECLPIKVRVSASSVWPTCCGRRGLFTFRERWNWNLRDDSSRNRTDEATSTHRQDWDTPQSEMRRGLVVVVERDGLRGECLYKILDERELCLICHRTSTE